MPRPSKDSWALALAQVVKTRSTCVRRAVGCVLLDADGRVLATGYNGRASGLPHCNEADLPAHFSPDLDVIDGVNAGRKLYPNACKAAFGSASGSDLDGCEALHAEQNALLQCPEVRDIRTAVVTTSPCVTCTKLFLNTGCQRIIYREEYPQEEARRLWETAGREWSQL